MSDAGGSLLLRAGMVNEEQLREAERLRQLDGSTLGESLIWMGVVDEERLVEFYHRRLMVPRISPYQFARIPRRVLEAVPADMAATFRVFPVALDAGDGTLTLVMADPSDAGVADEVGFFTGHFCQRAVAPASHIREAIRRHYGVRIPEPRPLLEEVLGGGFPDQGETPIEITAGPVYPPQSDPGVPALVVEPASRTSGRDPLLLTRVKQLDPRRTPTPAPTPVAAPPVAPSPEDRGEVATGVAYSPLEVSEQPEPGLVDALAAAAESAAAADSSKAGVEAKGGAADVEADGDDYAEIHISHGSESEGTAPPSHFGGEAAPLWTAAVADVATPPPASTPAAQIPYFGMAATSHPDPPILLLRQASSRDQIAGIVLSYALEMAPRAALFVVRKGMLCGHAGRGELLNVEALRAISIPVDSPSLFRDVMQSRLSYRGPLPDLPTNRAFTQLLGNLSGDILLMPVPVRDKVVAVLYADGIAAPLPDAALHAVAREAGLSYERLIRQQKR